MSKRGVAVVVVIVVAALIGAGYYFLNKEGTSLTSPVQSLKQGCGNSLCEEGETFNTCPEDCYNPSSSGPELAKLALSPADFPAPPQGTSWVKIYDQLLENDTSRIWPTLQDQNPLAIHNAVIRLSSPDDISWDQWGHLEQFILAFPPNKAAKALEAATGGDLAKLAAEAKVSIQELPDPAVGEKSKAFKITGQNGPSQWSQYIILFVKGNFVEYITFSGEKYEYQVFPVIARKAADKIQ